MECKGMKASLLPKADFWAVPPETKRMECHFKPTNRFPSWAFNMTLYLFENPVALEHTWSGDWAKLADCRRPWSRAGHRGFWFTFSTSCCQVILGLACVVRLNNLDFMDHRGRSCLVKTVWCKAKVWALTQLHSIKDKFKWHIKYVLYLFVNNDTMNFFWPKRAICFSQWKEWRKNRQ